MRSLLVIGTGGTIAGAASAPTQTIGYRAGAVPVTQLVGSVPGLTSLADIRTVQPFSIGSEHMRSAQWLELAGLARNAQGDPDVDGIVITHGTDTMEETAFFLDLVTGRDKPVVMTGAMRPATAVSADGPANLLAACRFALDPGAVGRGVLVALNDCAFTAATVGKVHTLRVDAFAARDAACVGQLVDDAVTWHDRLQGIGPAAFAHLALPERLPPVALILQHVDCDESIVDWHVARGAEGIVIAGSGNGRFPDAMRAALARASRGGCRIVRASRVAAGPVVRNGEAEVADRDDALGFIASGFVAPLKARILLQCCLIAGIDTPAIQQVFFRFGPTRFSA
jgi:L-asparaginase